MIERKHLSEKSRKHSSNNAKPKSCVQFSKLFQKADIVLPSQLQKFLSEEIRLPDNSEVSRNCSNKVQVVLKINESRDTPSCLTVNKVQNCVALIDPTPSRRSQTSNTSVNLFPFDSILTDNNSPNITNALIEPLLDFFKGRDSCLFSFGHSGLGKTKSMIGSDHTLGGIGIIPCALVWTFKLIECVQKTTKNIRYSVRMSVSEVSSKNIIRDLLVNYNVLSRRSATDPKFCGPFPEEKATSTLLSNQRELSATSLIEATHMLDAALASRSTDNESLTHLQLIIHLYQYWIDNASAVKDEGNNSNSSGNNNSCGVGISGGSEFQNVVKSRLFLLDLGSGRHGNEDQSTLSLQGMSKVILALYTSQRHVPYKDHVLTQMLKETLNPNMSTTMVLHISSKEQNYSETLQVVQLAYKLYRMRLKKYRSVGFSVSDEASSCSSSSSGLQSRRLRPHMGIGAARRSNGNSSASSELDLTSASELSCCETVIYKGNSSSTLTNKSPERLSGKRKLRSVSSESDNAFSDNDICCSSASLVSPSFIRRRRTSPRTNARVWPTPNDLTNNLSESGSELWVDGPNAVYKIDHTENEMPNTINQNPNPIKTFAELPSEPPTKPIMISKETQCDDVWDSGSSVTGDSSHSNTLDRKDHRPLSDISECTEETESNAVMDSELIKMSIIDQLEPTNDFDDLLESSFELMPMHDGNQFKYLSSAILSSQNITETRTDGGDKSGTSVEKRNSEMPGKLKIDSEDNLSVVKPVTEILPPTDHNLMDKKKYYSASESKRSSTSESKKRNKAKCKKCSRKANNNNNNNRSKSVSSSNSTDFSRVASWIENVEYEIHSSKSNRSDMHINPFSMGIDMHRNHHHSQPDISYQHDYFSANMAHFNPIPYHYPYPPNSQWLSNDSQQAHYSLYDGYQLTLTNPPLIPTSATNTNTSYLSGTPATSQIPSTQHVVTQSELVKIHHHHPSPNPQRPHTHLSNISLPNNGVSVNQLPLPPLPKANVYVDSQIRLEKPVNDPYHFNRPQSVSPIPVPVKIPVPLNSKCKTLPRDMYSDSDSIYKKNPKDFHSSRFACVPLGNGDNKSKEKFKKESNKIMTILFAPFINLKKKMSKTKTMSNMVLSTPEMDVCDNTLKVTSNDNNTDHHLTEWLAADHKSEPSQILSSPYHVVTNPKTSILPTESSGHGSDSSSLHNRELIKSRSNDPSRRTKTRSGSVPHTSKHFLRQRPTSSGYGSIIIKGDSEVSSHNDSSSEYSLSGLTNYKVAGGHNRLRHSMSLSNYKSNSDPNSFQLPKNSSMEVTTSPLSSSSVVRNFNLNENVKLAEDLIIQEKLKISLKEERKIVIQLIETNRLRGVPVDATVMNLMCFKCVDNFEVNSPTKRAECERLIDKIDQEIKLLKQKLVQAQNHLFLITSFDSHLQTQ